MPDRRRLRMLTIQFDGACFGNPGPMGLGVAILADGKVVKRISESAGKGTNNIAEYSAALRGLEEARKLKAREVVVQGDSQLVIRQLKGEWKVKEKHLQELHAKIRKMEKEFLTVKYQWVRREQNTLADELSKRGVEGKR